MGKFGAPQTTFHESLVNENCAIHRPKTAPQGPIATDLLAKLIAKKNQNEKQKQAAYFKSKRDSVERPELTKEQMAPSKEKKTNAGVNSMIAYLTTSNKRNKVGGKK